MKKDENINNYQFTLVLSPERERDLIIMLRRCTSFLSLILTFYCIVHLQSALAFGRPSFFSRISAAKIVQGTFKMSTDAKNIIAEENMNSAVHQLFGRFKIAPSQIFHKSAHSFAMVNLRPLIPG